MREVVREMGADAEGRLDDLRGILLNFDGLIRGQGVGEDDLLGTAVDVERLVLGHDLCQLLPVVATVDAQALEEVGKVLGEVERRRCPTRRSRRDRFRGLR
jgi:hypothetical protein